MITDTNNMTESGHPVGSRQDWKKARLELLELEKAHTREADRLARMRSQLPWVRVEKEYQFENEDGVVPFESLFRGNSQLLIYHFMFGPDYEAGCPSCSTVADGFNGIAVHLANHDVTLSAVSRGPFSKLREYKQRMGWTFPWASSFGSDFNYDFNVSFTEGQQRTGDLEYNFTRAGHAMDLDPAPEPVVQFATECGTDAFTYALDRPGMSAFIMEDGVVYHTYSAFARGLDHLWSMNQWLDLAPLGRNETEIWWHRHDEYGEDRKVEPTRCQTGAA